MVSTSVPRTIERSPTIPAELISAIAASDITIFNHNIGATLRFEPVPGNGIGVLNYATSDEILRAEWARIPYGLWDGVIGLVARQLAVAKRWRITCPNGTELSGSVTRHEHQAPASNDGFSLRNFPVGTHAPFSTADANGRIALRWFVSSQIHDIGPALRLDQPILAEIVGGRIAQLTGPAAEVARAERYLAKVAELTGKDGLIVNSWHAGVNPQAFTPWRDIDDLASWQTLTHNNPRTLHFHAVGAAVPGELSLPIVDHTVEIDGAVVWERGKLHLLDAPAVREAAAAWPHSDAAFTLNSAIGL
jgi:hypothetical protein